MADDQDLLEKAKNLVYFYLKFRPRTEHETQTYLQKKARRYKLTEGIIEKTIQTLRNEKLLDDQAFIAWHVDRRSRVKPKSRMLLTKELIKYGAPKELIGNFFEKEEFEEDGLAKKALSARWARWGRLPKDKRFLKAASFLKSRGFSYGSIKKAIAELEEKIYN